MLPDFRRGIGKQAFKRIFCYDGVPKEFENEEKINKNIKRIKYIKLEDISKLI